jgi:Zn-dependent metalloprotease
LLAAVALAFPATTDAAPPLKRLAQASARPLVVRTEPGAVAPYFVTGRIAVAGETPGERGRRFWSAHGAAFGLRDPDSELELRSVERDQLGFTHLAYEQHHRGLRVFGHEVRLHLDGRAVVAVSGEPASVAVATTPRIGAAGAAWTATLTLGRRAARQPREAPELLVHVDGAGSGRLAWLVRVPTVRPLGVWSVFVDARTGRRLEAFDELRREGERELYDGGNDPDCNTRAFPACALPGALARTELGPPSADTDVEAAYAHLGTVRSYLGSTYGRNSYDDQGHPIRATVNFGAGFNNAFWCSDACAESYASPLDEQLAFGDGDGSSFRSFARSLDVVTHELVHGLTASEAGLVYRGQSGALDESYSDVLAAMVDREDWLIGEDVVLGAGAIRSLAEPAAYGQPAHMSAYVAAGVFHDNGGVHVNSGIPNRVAYLVSDDPAFGIGRAATERIYYRALTTYLTPTSDFMANLAALLQSAADLFPGSAAHMRAITRAHAAVGLADRPTVLFPNGGETLQTGSSAPLAWLAGGDTGLPFRVEHVRSFGSTTYTQGFEAAAPATLPAEFESGGDQGWTVAAGGAGSGARSLRSGMIGHEQRSQVSFTRRTAFDGEVSFRLKVDSELGSDDFSFHVDGVQKVVEDGLVPWTTVAVFVPAGTHTFTWVYEKDELDTPPPTDDAAWIDDLVVPNEENAVTTPIAAATVPGATAHTWTLPMLVGPSNRIRVQLLGGIVPWLAADDSNASFGIGVAPAGADTSAPSDPVLHSATHLPGVSSTLRQVRITWTGAADEGSGVDGFSYAWSTNPAEDADTVKDAEENAAQVASAALRAGTHYFHLRTRDNAGNWSAGTRIGPFLVRAAPARCVVPNVRRKALAAARAAIRRAGCKPGRVRRVRAAKVKRGRVVRQSPAPGRRVPRGTPVSLVVSRG